jgi:hypothetical protein
MIQTQGFAMHGKFIALVLVARLALPLAAHAGPLADFERDLRGAYGQYRTALFQSNQGNADATAKALQSLSSSWASLEATWGTTPPPQYADDPGYSETLAEVQAVIAQATQEVAGGDLGKVHVTLEGLRADVAALHDRNGIISFSDRMNAYHAQMEDVIGLDLAAQPDGGLAALAEGAAVLAYLVADIVAHPAPEASDPAYGSALDAVSRSVDALQSAVHAGDAAAAKAAVGGLKVPYSKFFVKFG